uniref:AreA n=1 Tax=Klebsiella pneumoniae TaxID=573 RepID=A0A2P1BPC2_KLEPN|nr:hypothetical protein [Klebsiella pneumoniae]
MKLAPQSRDILRQYKALINARRRDAGQRELTTAQVMDEICEYMTCQCAVYIGGHFILQGKGTINHRAGEPLPLPAARNPGRLRLPERRRRASGAAHSPLRCQSLLPRNSRIIRISSCKADR